MRNSGLKIIFLLTAIVGFMIPSFAQIDPNKVVSPLDTTISNPTDSSNLDGLSTDSVYSVEVSDGNGIIKSQIDFTADDSITGGISSGEARLYNNAYVKYEDLTINAGYIYVNFKTNEMFASGIPDTSGKITQKPVFTEGGKSYRADEMRYNFDTKKAKIKKVITTEGEGFLHGEDVKKTGDNVFYVKNASYTTCSHEHPHFRIVTPKAKVITGEKVVTKFAYIEIVDVPTPLMVPFGFFPTTQKRKSGIIIPSYGNSEFRGYFLRNGGYYWAVNDYLDLTLTGDIYTQGGYGWNAATNYRKRYAYSGNFGVSYNLIRYGEPEFIPFAGNAFDRRTDFAIVWAHQQDPKSNPSFRFNSNVNIASGTFYQVTRVAAEDVLNNRLNSSVSFAKTWPGRPFNLNVSGRHSQNNKTKDLTITFPQIVFGLNRQFPFKPAVRVGKKKWYEEIGFSYTMTAANEVQTKLGKPFFTETVFQDSARNGVKHTIPLSANYKVFKHVVFSPSINYNQRWYFNKTNYFYDEDLKQRGQDTINGFFLNQDFNARADFTTKLYGLYTYRGKYVKAVRHVMTPNFGFSYKPDYSTDFWGYYQEVQIDSTGATDRFDQFANKLYGSASAGEQGNITMGIQNTLEAKVRSGKDSTGVTKVKLLERVSLNTAYNMAVDEFNWQPLSFRASSSAFKGLINMNYNATFDFYGYDPEGGSQGTGARVNKFASEVNGTFLRTTNQTFTTGLNLSANRFSKKKKPVEPIQGDNNDEKEGLIDELEKPETDLGISEGDPNYYDMPGYIDFKAPWTLNIDYNLQKQYTGLESKVVQSMRFSGDIKLTENWKIGFTSGYDFEANDFTYTTLDFYRDLHCWELRCTWVPFGFQQSYMLTIRVKSSVLSDLKLERRRGVGDFER